MLPKSKSTFSPLLVPQAQVLPSAADNYELEEDFSVLNLGAQTLDEGSEHLRTFDVLSNGFCDGRTSALMPSTPNTRGTILSTPGLNDEGSSPAAVEPPSITDVLELFTTSTIRSKVRYKAKERRETFMPAQCYCSPLYARRVSGYDVRAEYEGLVSDYFARQRHFEPENTRMSISILGGGNMGEAFIFSVLAERYGFKSLTMDVVDQGYERVLTTDWEYPLSQVGQQFKYLRQEFNSYNIRLVPRQELDTDADHVPEHNIVVQQEYLMNADPAPVSLDDKMQLEMAYHGAVSSYVKFLGENCSYRRPQLILDIDFLDDAPAFMRPEVFAPLETIFSEEDLEVTFISAYSPLAGARKRVLDLEEKSISGASELKASQMIYKKSFIYYPDDEEVGVCAVVVTDIRQKLK